MGSDRVLELLRREPSSDEYAEIRELWKRHSIAEENRDLPGLLSTLTEDCVYELVQTGHRWEGREGAARFYGGLLGAFPDIDFDLTDGIAEIPIEQRAGEEVATMTGRTADGRIETVRVVPERSAVANYAFDVTPARLVTGLITERGIVAPNCEALARFKNQ